MCTAVLNNTGNVSFEIFFRTCTNHNKTWAIQDHINYNFMAKIILFTVVYKDERGGSRVFLSN